jgi:hypothetical protein
MERTAHPSIGHGAGVFSHTQLKTVTLPQQLLRHVPTRTSIVASRGARVCRAGMGIGFRPDVDEASIILPEDKELDLPTDFGLSLRQMAAMGLMGEERGRTAEPLPVSICLGRGKWPLVDLPCAG